MSPRRATLAICCVLAVAFCDFSVFAQRPRFGTSTAAVMVDIIVRDKRGTPITDLAESDFEIAEDGVRQKILSFERVAVDEVTPPGAKMASAPASSPPRTSPAAPPAATAAPSEGQTVVALVFDWLSEQPRHDAWKAARTLLDDLKPNDYAGVFVIDQALQRLVAFTHDTAALNEAFRLAVERPRSASSRQNGALSNALVARPENSPTLAAEEGGVPASAVPSTNGSQNGSAELAAMLQRMDGFDRYADKERQATATINALRGLVQQLGALSGRKTVVLFSEGLSKTNSTIEQWGRLEDEANRHNVSFYTFDAVGLRVQSQQAEIGRVLPEAGGEGSAGLLGDSTERGLEAMFGGPTRGLAQLAENTGGQYLSNTNDLKTGFARVNADRRFHYLLGYSSTNAALDGSFRKISVKVLRSGVVVRSRRGYVASPSIERTDRRDYEAPALAAMSKNPAPMAFPFRLRAVSTPMPGRPGLTSLLAAVDNASLTYEQDAASGRYAGQATVVARVTAKDGAVLTTQSQHYELGGELARLSTLKDGSILFFSTPEVPPGSHRVDWVVSDDGGARASVARSAVEVPQSERPIVGDLIIVSRTERAPKNAAAARNPLVWKDSLIYPSFGEPISRSRQHELAFALPMVLGPHDKTTAVVQLIAAGQAVAQLPFELGPPQKDGRLVALGRLPLDALPPGQYALRATVVDGARREIRTAGFSITK